QPQQIPSAVEEKVLNDAVAYIRSAALRNKRNAEWAEKAVRESVSITGSEALKLNVIDILAENLNSLLENIDGRTVELAAGKHVIKTKGIIVRYKEVGTRHKILNFISDPNVAYLLMLLGFYGIFFEFTNPGAIFPGVFGAISLILAFYSFQTLPVNYAGLLLIILAIILFLLEIKIISHGILAIGGIISMIIGSLMLFETSQPFFRLSLTVILPAVVITALFFTLTIAMALKAQRRKPQTGIEGLIGITGNAKTDISSGGGTVFVHGEIWSAWSDEPVKAGEGIIVERVEGLKLKVHASKDRGQE
ncbi:MAG: nodulation protein NfeD, partial [Nitrospirae bacterium]|nr:nodulation protein NfeD [Nitrospirota bacterium]